LWPGYGENIRVLEWIFDRCNKSVTARETAIGFVPEISDIDVKGIEKVGENLGELLKVNNSDWLVECELIEEHYAKFGDRLPLELQNEFTQLKTRLKEESIF
jgi:phosphoenolpyruvate carboxykinase (GTP)